MSVANSYARALYQAATDKGASSEVLLQLETDMNSFDSLLSGSKEMRSALLGWVTTSREKAQIVEEFAKKMGLSEILKQFLLLLARKERMDLLSSIKDAFNSVRLEMEGGLSCSLVSADPISDSDVDILAKAFSKKLGKKVAFRVSTDPSLLAGVKVTVNGVTYDGTLRSQLQKLRDRFVAGLPGANGE
jgi:F-type H+-transporting ATPase subunit delta